MGVMGLSNRVRGAMLDRLEQADIAAIHKNADGTFCIMERCDDHFQMTVTIDDIRQLIQDLQTIVDGTAIYESD